jgi:hypothetical protein
LVGVVSPIVVAVLIAGGGTAVGAAAPRHDVGVRAATETAWNAAIAQQPTPGAGCFQAAYPMVEWHAVRCGRAPNIRMEPARQPEPPSPSVPVGNGNDMVGVAAAPLWGAEGSFAGVSPKITETGQYNATGPQLANVFSLQINSNRFATPLCLGSRNPVGCQGWQQFIYSSHDNLVFMQLWLINYIVKPTDLCPHFYLRFQNSCYRNSSAAPFQGASLRAADLATVKFEGTAYPQGGFNLGNDEVFLSNAGKATAALSFDAAGLDLALGWNTAEFGVFGDLGGGQANFGPNTTLQVQTRLFTNSSLAPQCVQAGTTGTGETNNLNLTAMPSGIPSSSLWPMIESNQTDNTATSPTCARLSGTVRPTSHANSIAVRESDGETDVVAEGPFNSLLYYWKTPDQSVWQKESVANFGTTYAAPSIVVRPDGEADIVTLGPTNTLWYYSQAPGLTSWKGTQIGGLGTTWSEPAIALRPNGEADVVAEGPNHSLVYYWAKPGSAWQATTVPGSSGQVWSDPSIVTPNDSAADVVAQGPGYTLQLRQRVFGLWGSSVIDPLPSTWSDPSITPRSTNEYNVVAQGLDSSLHYYQGKPGSAWQKATIAGMGTTGNDPTITVRTTGEADIVNNASLGALKYYNQAAPGSPWVSASVAGTASTWSDPAIATQISGEADIVAQGPSNSLDFYWSTPGSVWHQATIAGAGTTFQ